MMGPKLDRPGRWWALGVVAFACPCATAATIQVLSSASPAWQTAYAGFATTTSFESLALPAGLSITLEGGAFPAAQTYSSLPRLFDPGTVSSSGGFGGPYPTNRWDGTHMATNFGFDAGLAAGQNWTNSWAPTTSSLSARFTLNFAGGAGAVGVGLSNFQSDLTSHRLFINGVPQALSIEAIAGANWVSGRFSRNGYLVVTADPGSPIYSVGIGTITALDGMNFDALGYTPADNLVPLPSCAGLGAVGLVGLGVRRRRTHGRSGAF